MIDQTMLWELANSLGHALIEHDVMLVTAESCTGGMVASTVTDIAGSSGWFERGYVTYSNEAKEELLAVPAVVLTQFGAVSEETACAMANGALRASHAQLAVSITGIAGPGGAVPGKPVGTVCFAWARRDADVKSETVYFPGDRASVRQQATYHALKGVLALVLHR